MTHTIRKICGSIAVKVMTVILALGAMIAAAITIGTVLFGQFSTSLDTLVDTHLPGIAATVEVSTETSKVEEALTLVLLAASQDELDTAAAGLAAKRDALDAAVAHAAEPPMSG